MTGVQHVAYGVQAVSKNDKEFSLAFLLWLTFPCNHLVHNTIQFLSCTKKEKINYGKRSSQ